MLYLLELLQLKQQTRKAFAGEIGCKYAIRFNSDSLKICPTIYAIDIHAGLEL
tara:strand:- start:228 stop:386 length:159 start_codon:yes stop_codon:yes gene_type:complete